PCCWHAQTRVERRLGTMSVDARVSSDRAAREQARESHFWDAFASTVAVEPVETGPLDTYTRARLRLLGDVAGKRVLDLGCGVGHFSTLLALRGAHVAAVDISERCVAITRERARASGVGQRVATQ